MFSWRGVVAVVVAAFFVSIPIYFYWEFLTKGMRPTEATQILNRLEKDGVPNFTLKTMDGKDVSIADFNGKVLLINIWATWCAPCVKEFPSLKHLVQLFKGRVVVLAVSRDYTREDIDTFVQAFGGLPEDFIIVWDKENTTGKLLGTDVLPETYILSPKQHVVRKIAGEARWDEPMAQKFFKEILDDAEASASASGH